MSLPGLLSREEVQARLTQIFPEGVAKREQLVWPVAASTVFTALYIGAIKGNDVWLAPKHVYRMTAEQSIKTSMLKGYYMLIILLSRKEEYQVSAGMRILLESR